MAANGVWVVVRQHGRSGNGENKIAVLGVFSDKSEAKQRAALQKARSSRSSQAGAAADDASSSCGSDASSDVDDDTTVHHFRLPGRPREVYVVLKQKSDSGCPDGDGVVACVTT